MALTRRTLGTDGPPSTSPQLGLGCMGMSEFYGTADEQTGIDTIHRALDLGVTFLDTADMYGPFTNEELVGKAIAGPARRGRARHQVRHRARPRRQLGPASTARPDYVRAGLRRLAAAARRRPHRPLLPAPRRPGRSRSRRPSAPWPSWSTPARSATSACPRPRPTRSAGRTPCTRSPRCRREYSLFTRDLEDEILPTIRELGIGLVPYSPARPRLPHRRDRPGESLDADDFRATGTSPLPGRGARRQPRARREGQASSPAEHGCTPGQLALAWVLAQGDDVVPIPGTKRVAYLEENVGADRRRAHRRRPRGARGGRPARRRGRRPLRRHEHGQRLSASTRRSVAGPSTEGRLSPEWAVAGRGRLQRDACTRVARLDARPTGGLAAGRRWPRARAAERGDRVAGGQRRAARPGCRRPPPARVERADPGSGRRDAEERRTADHHRAAGVAGLDRSTTSSTREIGMA